MCRCSILTLCISWFIIYFFFFKQKTAYEMRISDWSSDVCSSDLKTFGKVDILVNNAGIQTVAPVEEFPDDRWELIQAINLSSNFYAIKAAMPGMKARNWGRIVNIASAHGLVASPYKIAYEIGRAHV